MRRIHSSGRVIRQLLVPRSRTKKVQQYINIICYYEVSVMLRIILWYSVAWCYAAVTAAAAGGFRRFPFFHASLAPPPFLPLGQGIDKGEMMIEPSAATGPRPSKYIPRPPRIHQCIQGQKPPSGDIGRYLRYPTLDLSARQGRMQKIKKHAAE